MAWSRNSRTPTLLGEVSFLPVASALAVAYCGAVALGSGGARASSGGLEHLSGAGRRLLGWELAIVLGLSLGKSAVYALVNLANRLTWTESLKDQATTIHSPASPRPWWDLLYQVLGIGFALVPCALALYLLARSAAGGMRGACRGIGLDGSRPWRDVGWGAAIAAVIGVPGLAFYAAGRAAGITIHVQTSALDQYWWTIPVLVLSAVENGLVEEVIVVAYLARRLEELRFGAVGVYVFSAALRGAYHLYQGFGPFIANAAMGVAFLWWYRRTGRIGPLVAGHALLDIVAFVGPCLLPTGWLG